MAVDVFLKIEGIKGESADEKHAGEIDILSFNWGMNQTGTTHTGTGGGAGKVNVQDLSITKLIDRSTPVLMKHCCAGVHIKEALLTVRKAGGKPLEYMKLKMKDVLVSSLTTGAAGSDERPTETVTLNFASVEYEYVPQKADGSGDASIQMSWNIAKNSEK